MSTHASTTGRRCACDNKVAAVIEQPTSHPIRTVTNHNALRVLSYIMLGCAALLPQLFDAGRFLTEDEANFWLHRSQVFLNALRAGNFAATAITYHPGVTTTWLGSAGIVLRTALLSHGIVRDGSFPMILELTHIPLMLTHMLVIILGYWLLRSMVPPLSAALAALLWAVDPFVVAYSRILHVDALAGSFLTLSILAACRYWNHQRHWSGLLLSAIAAGLAILSKSPSLAILPIIALLALVGAQPATPRRRLSELCLWGVGCAATVVLLWPALWVAPLNTLTLIRTGVMIEGLHQHELGNFFLGQPDDAPGPLFYPVALVLRLTPWTLLGLLLLPLALRHAGPATRRDILAWSAFVVLFLLAMTVFPKKFNRYLEPAFPLIDLLATLGLLAAARLLQRTRASLSDHLARREQLLAAVIALGSLINLAWWHPYEIAAFNQILGGARAGANTFQAGWGEGLDQVADWLNQRPDITGVITVNPMNTALQPYMRHGALGGPSGHDSLPDDTGYVVVYLRQVQRNELDPPFNWFYDRVTPLHTVLIHGVPDRK